MKAQAHTPKLFFLFSICATANSINNSDNIEKGRLGNPHYKFIHSAF